MRINASWFGLHWPTEYKYVGASVCVRRQAPLGYLHASAQLPECV